MALTYENTTVNPSLAREWLALNAHNRGINATLIDRLARDMRAGKWQETGEAVKFDKNGNLADGQHRLHAIIKAGVTLPLFVIRGIEPEAQDVMDTGRTRTAADVATLHGVKNAGLAMSITRILASEPSLGYVSAFIKTPSHSELLDMLALHPEIHEAATVAMKYGKSLGISSSNIGACWARLSQVDANATVEFFESLHAMAFDGESDPRAVLRRALVTRPEDFRRNRLVTLSAILRTWNAWRQGEHWQRMAVARQGRPVSVPDLLV